MPQADFLPDVLPQNNNKVDVDTAHTADAYLTETCGFDIAAIKGWYEQGNYGHPAGDRGTKTVRFFLNNLRQVMWERLIAPVTISYDDKRKTIDANSQGLSDGLWWQPPGFSIGEKDDIYWCIDILDAIALNLCGFKTVAIMSSESFPAEAIKPHLGKQVKWIIALNNGNRFHLREHAKKLGELEENLGAAISSEHEERLGWNELYKAGKLTDKDMVNYLHLGRVELAKNHYEKAMTLWEHNQKKTYFIFTFANSTYSFSIDPTEYEKAHTLEHERDPLTADKIAFNHASKIKEIATFKMDFLYFQKPDNGEDGQYFFRFNFSNKAAEVQLPFGGKTFGGAGDFKKSVMQQTPSALFTGSTKDLDHMYRDWMGRIPKIVKTLDYVGYDRSTGAYVYVDYAVENGQLIKLNKESFFQLRNSGIKTTMDIKQKLNTQQVADWLPDYHLAFGTGGMVALSWWLGCLVVEQIRQQHRSYPFIEVVGEAAAGKSDMVDFLWKLLGREGESFNPNSSTPAGRTRKMAEVSNLPVVFNETDNEKVAEDRHAKQFNWDEQKDLFDGEFGRVTGQKTQDNSTRKPTFKAGLMIVQNVPVAASEAIMSRIVHLQFDRSHHSIEGKHASDRLNMLPVMDVSGFLLHSVQRADAILKKFNEQFSQHRIALQNNPKLKLQRIIENHAKIMAFADCLPLVVPVSAIVIADVHRAVIAMAEIRQESMNEDHPVVEWFWGAVDYFDTRAMSYTADGASLPPSTDLMNHSNNPELEWAIHVGHLLQVCREKNYPTPYTEAELNRHLPSSRHRKYKDNKSIRSRLDGIPKRCRLFVKTMRCRHCGYEPRGAQKAEWKCPECNKQNS